MRALVLLAFALLLAFSLSGQSRFSFGLSTQIGLSGKTNMDSNEGFGTSTFRTYRTQGNYLVPMAGAGGWAAYKISGGVSVQLGLQYTNTGNTHLNEGWTETMATGQRSFSHKSTHSFRVHQAQLPLELKLSIPTEKIQPEFIIGAQLSYDWIGTVYAESPFNRDADDNPIVMTWTKPYRTGFDYARIHVQPVIGVGLRLNERLSIGLRHTWIKEEQHLSWYEHSSLFTIPGITGSSAMFCGTPNYYWTKSTHRQTTAIKMEYSLF